MVHDLQPWIDPQFAQSGLFIFDKSLTSEQWANIGVTGIWRSEILRPARIAVTRPLPGKMHRGGGDRPSTRPQVGYVSTRREERAPHVSTARR